MVLVLLLLPDALPDTLPPARWVEVVTGAAHACALDSDRLVTCWGVLPAGQEPPQEADFVAISAGLHHTCGLTDHGRVRCWGDINHAPSGNQFTRLASADHYTCAQDQRAALVCVSLDRVPDGMRFDLATVEAAREARRPHCQIQPSGALHCRGDRVLRQGARTLMPTVPQPGHPRHPLTRSAALLDEFGHGFAWWGSGLESSQWVALADQALLLADALSGLEVPQAHEQRFLLLLLAGEAMENSTASTHVQTIGDTTVNIHYYHAACMAASQESLLRAVVNEEHLHTVQFYIEQIQNGTLPAAFVP